MARSTKKGPFVDTHLMTKVEVMNTAKSLVTDTLKMGR